MRRKSMIYRLLYFPDCPSATFCLSPPAFHLRGLSWHVLLPRKWGPTYLQLKL